MSEKIEDSLAGENITDTEEATASTETEKTAETEETAEAEQTAEAERSDDGSPETAAIVTDSEKGGTEPASDETEISDEKASEEIEKAYQEAMKENLIPPLDEVAEPEEHVDSTDPAE